MIADEKNDHVRVMNPISIGGNCRRDPLNISLELSLKENIYADMLATNWLVRSSVFKVFGEPVCHCQEHF